MKKINILILLMLFLICTYSPASADGSPGLEGPYIQESFDLSIENITIKILNGKITFEYKIFNTSDLDIEKKFSIIVPSHTWTIPRSEMHDESFKNITLMINNISIDFADETKSYFNGIYISNILKHFMIPQSIRKLDTFSSYIEKNENIKKFLIDKKYIDTLSETQHGKEIVQYVPLWTVVPIYTFKCMFKPKKYTTILYSYTVIPEFFYDKLEVISQGLAALGQDTFDIKKIFDDKGFDNIYDCTWIKQNISSFGASSKINSLDIYAGTNNTQDKNYVSLTVGTNMQSIDKVYNSFGINSTELHVKNFILEGNLIFFTAKLHVQN